MNSFPEPLLFWSISVESVLKMLIWISIEIDSIDSIDFVNISFYLYFHCQDFNKTFNYRFGTITFLWGLFRDFPFPLQEENWCRTKLNSNGQLRIFSFRKSHSRHVCSKLQNNEQIAEPICLLASKKCYDYQRSIGVSFLWLQYWVLVL